MKRMRFYACIRSVCDFLQCHRIHRKLIFWHVIVFDWSGMVPENASSQQHHAERVQRRSVHNTRCRCLPTLAPRSKGLLCSIPFCHVVWFGRTRDRIIASSEAAVIDMDYSSYVLGWLKMIRLSFNAFVLVLMTRARRYFFALPRLSMRCFFAWHLAKDRKSMPELLTQTHDQKNRWQMSNDSVKLESGLAVKKQEFSRSLEL